MKASSIETRTREIRALDVVLSKARIGTRLQIDVHDPRLDAQTESISTVFLNDALRATEGRAKTAQRSRSMCHRRTRASR